MKLKNLGCKDTKYNIILHMRFLEKKIKPNNKEINMLDAYL